MDATYDMQTDSFVIRFKEGHILQSGELTPGIIADYDRDGHIVRLEFLDASKSIVSPSDLRLSINFSVE